MRTPKCFSAIVLTRFNCYYSSMSPQPKCCIHRAWLYNYSLLKVIWHSPLSPTANHLVLPLRFA